MDISLNAADALLLVDHESGEVVEGENENVPRAVASLTKVAACMVALEWSQGSEKGIGYEFEVPKSALRGGANPLSLQVGDRVTLETAIASAMLASDNTAVAAMASALGRDMDPGEPDGMAVFVARMNALAKDLGMSKTHFVNPHGLDEPGASGVSTAADLARLVIRVYDQGILPQFTSATERELGVLRNGKEIRIVIKNTNELVGSRGIDGLKTGTTRLAGACLIASATRQTNGSGSHRLHAILLGSEDRFRDAVLLLNRGWKTLTEGLPSESNQNLRKGRD